MQATLARLGMVLGDSAPCSSITRASRIQARYQLGERAFIDVLDDVSRRVIKAMPRVTRRDRVGRPNGMPYFFASVEASLAATRQAPPGSGPRGRGSLRVRCEPPKRNE